MSYTGIPLLSQKNRAKGLKILCARVYDSKKRVVDEQLTAERKRQIGTAERSERIRTYNYPQVCFFVVVFLPLKTALLFLVLFWGVGIWGLM